MTALDTISSLIDSAKRLRAIADELGQVDLKSRILGEIGRLQELREQLGSGEAFSPAAKATDHPPATRSKLPGLEGSPYARLKPSSDGETYALAGSDPEADAWEEAGSDSDDLSDTKFGITATSDTAQIPTSQAQFKDLPEEERIKIAEQRIAELEPLHQAALKNMNEVLTPRQAAIKVAATKKGLAAGRRGKILQEGVMAALQLSEEQQQQMADARRELREVRLAIAKEVEGLLSKEQLDRILRSHRYK